MKKLTAYILCLSVVVLLYENEAGEEWLVTLSSHEDTYWFRSNLPCAG